MSETATQQDTPQGAPQPPAEEYRPTDVLSSEDEAAPDNQPEPDKPAAPDAEKEAAEAKRREVANEARRMAHLTRLRYEEKARAEAAEQRARELEARLRKLEAPEGAPNSPEAIERQISEAAEKRAEQMLAEREQRGRVDAFHKAGSSEFPDWPQRCKELIDLGADQGIAAILVDMGTDGARVAGALVDDPGEVARIAQIQTERGRALALGQYAASLEAKRAAAPPVSRAPPPIRPPSGGRRTDPSPEGSMEDYLRWSERQRWR